METVAQALTAWAHTAATEMEDPAREGGLVTGLMGRSDDWALNWAGSKALGGKDAMLPSFDSQGQLLWYFVNIWKSGAA